MTVDEESAIRAWLRHIEEDDPGLIAHCIAQCRVDPDKRSYFLKRAEEAPAIVAPVEQATHGCTDCMHRRGRHDLHWGCVAREDLVPMYGEGHPLRVLPEDGGADCKSFEARPTWH